MYKCENYSSQYHLLIKMSNDNEKILLHFLKQTKEILEKHNIVFWLECGTLLGAVRDGRFISWEYDLDFGVWSKNITHEKKLEIAREFSTRGFSTYVAESHMNISKDPFHTDINFYELRSNIAIVPLSKPTQVLGKLLELLYQSLVAPYHYTIDFKTTLHKSVLSIFLIVSRLFPSRLRDLIKVGVYIVYQKMPSKDVSWKVPVHYLSMFSIIKFYGMEFKIPAKTEEYLTARYGRNWRVPRRDWITERDDKCVAV